MVISGRGGGDGDGCCEWWCLSMSRWRWVEVIRLTVGDDGWMLCDDGVCG